MPQLLLSSHQAHLLLQIQNCTGQEDPFDAIESFIISAVQTIESDWLARFGFMALVNLGTPLNKVTQRHFQPDEVAKLLGMTKPHWEMSVAALRELAPTDMAISQVFEHYDSVFVDYIILGAMVALMAHYNIPTGLAEEYTKASRPVLGYFLGNLLKTEMLIQMKLNARREEN